jgi:hypothetical protein
MLYSIIANFVMVPRQKYFPDVDDDEVADEEADRLGLLVRSLAVIVSDG